MKNRTILALVLCTLLASAVAGWGAVLGVLVYALSDTDVSEGFSSVSSTEIPAQRATSLDDAIRSRLDNRSLPHKKTLSSLDQEAAKVARETWKPVKIGDSYYVRSVKEFNISDFRKPELTSRSWTLFELREPIIDVGSRKLDEADKLNGLEWAAVVHLSAKVSRQYNSEEKFNSPARIWSAWDSSLVDRCFDLRLRKLNGKWIADKEQSVRYTFEEVKASDIPK